MGVVHKARNRTSGELVALKILDPSLCSDSEMRARFKAEAQLISRVKHPNVVGFLEYGEIPDGQLFMATELVEGSSLRKLLEAETVLSPSRVIGIARALLAGLAAIHRQGIIHRDIKPTNILIDRQGTLKIIDFGIARDAANRIHRTRSGELVGTPWYLSPEQIRGEVLKPSTDVYAAGAILYEALVGHPPFTGESLHQILEAHLDSRLVPLRDLMPECPHTLAATVERMLSRDLSERFPSGTEAHKAMRSVARELADEKSDVFSARDTKRLPQLPPGTARTPENESGESRSGSNRRPGGVRSNPQGRANLFTSLWPGARAIRWVVLALLLFLAIGWILRSRPQLWGFRRVAKSYVRAAFETVGLPTDRAPINSSASGTARYGPSRRSALKGPLDSRLTRDCPRSTGPVGVRREAKPAVSGPTAPLRP